jgi:Lipid A 3-O-deacylase (PagL)
MRKTPFQPIFKPCILIRIANIGFQFERSLLFCLLLLICAAASAQQKDIRKRDKFKRLVIEAQYSAGKVVPVYPGFPSTTFANVVELHLGYQTGGEQPWNKIFNYPRLGVSLIYQNLGNNQVLGQQFSIVPTVYFSTARKETARVYAEIRYGLGLAIFNRPYDSIKNPRNLGVGEHTTWQFTLGANLRWNFSRYMGLQLGGIWYHASDSHTALPNVGVNNFGGYLGLIIKPFGTLPRVHTYDSIPLESKWHFNFRLGAGYNRKGSAFGPASSPAYPVYTASVYASKRVAKVITLKVGATYRYYASYRAFIDDTAFTSRLALKSSAFLVFTGFEFMLGHFAINLEAGLNLYKPAYKPFYNYYEASTTFNYWTKQLIPTRFGVNYYILDPYNHTRNNVFLGVNVCANLGQAEFMEFCAGYVF